MNKFIAEKELSEIYGITHIFKLQKKQVKQVLGNMNSILDSAKGCMKCVLGATRKNIVFGDGNENAALMFVGEGPGEDEDETGLPFVGRAGQLLTKMITAMGYSREEVYIANIVKCRPPDNRQPFQSEANACIGYLKAQIHVVNPKVIVCLGATAAKYLLNTKNSITKIRGMLQKLDGIDVMPTFHPAYLLRDPSKKKETWQDLQAVMKLLETAQLGQKDI